MIGIEKQIGRLHDEHAAVADGQPRRQVQAVDEILGLIGVAVAVGVFQDRDAIGAARPARRRVGHAVVFRAQVLIDFDRRQARGIGILKILNDPHPPAPVERHGNGLANFGLAGKELQAKARRHLEMF